MTPGLRKDIRCHVWPYYFLCLQIIRLGIRLQVKCTVSLVISVSHFNLSRGFMWVNIFTLSPSRVRNAFWGSPLCSLKRCVCHIQNKCARTIFTVAFSMTLFTSRCNRFHFTTQRNFKKFEWHACQLPLIDRVRKSCLSRLTTHQKFDVVSTWRNA